MPVQLSCAPSKWVTVAACSPVKETETLAAFIAVLTIIPDLTNIDETTKAPYQFQTSGPVCIQHLTGTQVSRLLVFNDTGIVHDAFGIPCDSNFMVTHRKVKGTKKSRGIEVTMNAGPGPCSEGYELIKLMMPFDGDENGPAFLMFRALEHASQLAEAAVLFFKNEADKKATAAAAAAAGAKDGEYRRMSDFSAMSIDSPFKDSLK
jgi:hypothetical protein